MTFGAKQYLWAANLLMAALVIWTGVGLMMSVLEHNLEERTSAPGRMAADRAEAPGLKPLDHYEAISDSRVFGGEGHTPAPAAEPGPTAAPRAETADIGWKLKGTIVDASTDFFLAVLEDPGSHEQNLYRIGDEIGPYRIESMDRESVTVRQGDREIRLVIYQDETAALPFSPGNSAPAAAPPESMNAAQAENPLARQVGPNSFIVSRDVLSQQMSNLNQLLSQIRIQPYLKDGQPYGFLLAAIRAGSPPAQMGILSGDVVVQVNGTPVTSPEDLVNLYQQMQQVDTVEVLVERRGEPLTLTYSLR